MCPSINQDSQDSLSSGYVSQVSQLVPMVWDTSRDTSSKRKSLISNSLSTAIRNGIKVSVGVRWHLNRLRTPTDTWDTLKSRVFNLLVEKTLRSGYVSRYVSQNLGTLGTLHGARG